MSYALRPVVIAGNSQRPSLFGRSLTDDFGFHAAIGQSLGQSTPTTPQEWFEYARRQVSEFDVYLLRARKIAYRPVAESLVFRYATDAILHLRDVVERQVSLTEATTGPTRYENFRRESVQRDVEELRDVKRDLKRDVETAENLYGSVAAPVVEIRERVVEVPGATPGWVLPVLGIGAAVGLAALLGVFK